MKKMFALFLLAMVFSLTACYDPNKPDPPKPDEPHVFYTLEVFYTRPEILCWERVNYPVSASLLGMLGTGCKLSYAGNGADKYNLVGEFQQPIPDNENNGLMYEIWVHDWAKWDGVNNDTRIAGAIFVLRVKETGFTKELKNIQPNRQAGNPYQGPNAKLALFRLMKDGTIRDE
jgi:hypothetical protein